MVFFAKNANVAIFSRFLRFYDSKDRLLEDMQRNEVQKEADFTMVGWVVCGSIDSLCGGLIFFFVEIFTPTWGDDPI